MSNKPITSIPTTGETRPGKERKTVTLFRRDKKPIKPAIEQEDISFTASKIEESGPAPIKTEQSTTQETGEPSMGTRDLGEPRDVDLKKDLQQAEGFEIGSHEKLREIRSEAKK